MTAALFLAVWVIASLPIAIVVGAVMAAGRGEPTTWLVSSDLGVAAVAVLTGALIIAGVV